MSIVLYQGQAHQLNVVKRDLCAYARADNSALHQLVPQNAGRHAAEAGDVALEHQLNC
jgi:hypothetical protein